MSRHTLLAILASVAATVGVTGVAVAGDTPAAFAGSAHPYEAIADHYQTVREANAVAAEAQSKGVRTVVQVNGPGKVEVEYGNGFSAPAPALALCATIRPKGLPCRLGREQHGVPPAWNGR